MNLRLKAVIGKDKWNGHGLPTDESLGISASGNLDDTAGFDCCHSSVEQSLNDLICKGARRSRPENAAWYSAGECRLCTTLGRARMLSKPELPAFWLQKRKKGQSKRNAQRHRYFWHGEVNLRPEERKDIII